MRGPPLVLTETATSGREAMATYIIRANFTDQGIRNIKDSPRRKDAFRKLCEKMGARVKEAYRTMGRYDVAANR